LVIEHSRAGKLRVLAVTTPTRFDSLPDIPTVGEFVPDYVASQWFAMGLRKNTPAEIMGREVTGIDIKSCSDYAGRQCATPSPTTFASSEPAIFG
jgi:hypothetical protein